MEGEALRLSARRSRRAGRRGLLRGAALDDLDDLPALLLQHAGALTGEQRADGRAAALLDEVDVVLVAQRQGELTELRAQV